MRTLNLILIAVLSIGFVTIVPKLYGWLPAFSEWRLTGEPAPSPTPQIVTDSGGSKVILPKKVKQTLRNLPEGVKVHDCIFFTSEGEAFVFLDSDICEMQSNTVWKENGAFRGKFDKSREIDFTGYARIPDSAAPIFLE